MHWAVHKVLWQFCSVAIFASEIGKAVSKETKIDILVTPLVTIGVGGTFCMVGSGSGKCCYESRKHYHVGYQSAAVLMGILVSVFVGIALTLPISSAAICAALGLTGLAGGAAVAGCCAQMVGFAVMSFRENKWEAWFPRNRNFYAPDGKYCKNPRIWIAPILTSAITGPIATCLFKLQMNGTPVSSGMGTCGFVGQIGVYTGWMNDIAAEPKLQSLAGTGQDFC